MKTKDFENAIADSGVEMLGVELKDHEVVKCFGQVPGTLTYVMWDDTGRAFVFTQPEDEECCISSFNMEYLPYERDAKFDLVFE